MSSQLNNLPDLPLLNILKRLPLYDLVYGAGQTSVRLRALAPTEYSRRHSLVLTHDDDQDKSLNYHRLDERHCGHFLQEVQRDVDGGPLVRFPTLEQYKFNFVPLQIAVQGLALMNALTGLTHLTVSYTNISPSSLSHIIRMLNHWSATLVSLTLDLKKVSALLFDRINDETLLSMFEAINRLGSLQHLKLNLNSYDCVRISAPNLEVVSRLATLCVGGNIEPNWFFPALQQHGATNDNIRQVCYHADVGLDNQRMLTFGLQYPRLANCFTSLYSSLFLHSFWYDPWSSRKMEQMCTRFGSLTSLGLEMEPSAMSGLARHLARLQHLVTLMLFITRYEDDGELEGDNAFSHGWPVLDRNRAPLDQGLLVRSVRVLELSLVTVSHDNIDALRIANIFPNVQFVRVSQISGPCYSCTPNATEFEYSIFECLPRALRPFRECAHLRIIEYNTGLLGPMRRITPQQLAELDEH